MTGLRIRPFRHADAPAASAILNDIIAQGGMTAYQDRFSPDRLEGTLCAGPQTFCAHVALRGGKLVGFQTLNPHSDLPDDCADIASFVHLRQLGSGVGRALFARTLARAQILGLRGMTACIRADNAAGLGFYRAMGFAEQNRLRAVPLACGKPMDRVVMQFALPHAPTAGAPRP